MTTNLQATIGDATITLRSDGTRAAAASGLLFVLREMPEGTLVDGRVITLHGSTFRLRANDEGFDVLAPDYLGDPLTDLTDDLSVALWIIDVQAALLRRFGADAQPCRWDSTIVVQRGVLDAQAVYLHRTATTHAGHSGWFIGAVDSESAPGVDDLEKITVHELVRRRRPLVQVLGLPDGHLAIVVGDEVDGVQGPDGEMLPDASPRAKGDPTA